jgi:hypothetical protein
LKYTGITEIPGHYAMGADGTNEVRDWSGPIQSLGDDERQTLVDSMTADSRPRIAIAEALRNNWFEVWYQPKIDLKRKCLAGAGAHPAS